MAPSRETILGSHYLNQYAIQVCAAILRPGNELLVVGQLDRGLERIKLPGGVPHFSETLQQAVVREVFPHVAEFRSSKRGRYVDRTVRNHRSARQHSGLP
jgi:hypothetical protein